MIRFNGCVMDRARLRTKRERHTSFAAGLAVALAISASACGSPAESMAPVTFDIPDTVPTGELPDLPTDQTAPTLPRTSTASSTASSSASTTASRRTSTTEARQITIERTTTPVVTEPGPIGERAGGNRLLVIGDSLMSSVSETYSGLMCEALTGFGWDVEVDAQTSRFIDFGHLVVDTRLRPADDLDWDAAVIFLGNNNGGDVEAFGAELDELLDKLAPRPTLLLTITETDLATIGMNRVIREQPDRHPHVTILDWARVSEDGASELLAGDGLHLSTAGQNRLVILAAAELGDAPGFGDGECLRSVYRD